MGDTKISWAERSWNQVLAEPLRRRKPTTYFVNSMSDLFHDGFTNEQIAAVFGVMAATPQHTFIVLTKRAQRMRQWFGWVTSFEVTSSGDGGGQTSAEACRDAAINILGRRSHGSLALLGYDMRWPMPNVILGVSAENQATADERIPHLLATPAAVRLVSAEPLLGPIVIPREYLAPFHDLDPMLRPAPRIGWVIAGCESGTGARPCEVAWLRSLRDQCVAAEVPFFLKQAKADVLGRTADFPRGTPIMHSMGLCPVIAEGPGSKIKPGGIIELPYLDGVQWAQRPEVRR